MKGKYDDIILTEYPRKNSRPRMSLHDRAAQFAPFAALTGYDILIDETVRTTEKSFENDEADALMDPSLF